MPEISVDRPETDELFEWIVDSGYASDDDFSVAMDVIGQNRVPEASSIERLEPRLDNLQLVGVFKNSERANAADIDERTELVSNSNGERYQDFYEEFFGTAEFFSASVAVENIDECLEQARSMDTGLRNHPEFESGNVRFGTGFDNRYVESDKLMEAYREVEDVIGFQLFFDYFGDREASEKFSEYQADNPLVSSDTEGVTGVVCIGREETPVVYTAGPPDLDVEMPEIPGYSNDVDTRGLEELL